MKKVESLAELKSGLHHYIAETDDFSTLSKIREYVSELMQKENKVIAYTSDGRALNQSEYKKDIDKAMIEAQEGFTISIEELEKGD